MSMLPSRDREVVRADLKAAYEEIKRAKALLSREDPQQAEAWDALDRAEARLRGLPAYLGLS
jgi:hypothetical protein